MKKSASNNVIFAIVDWQISASTIRHIFPQEISTSFGVRRSIAARFNNSADRRPDSPLIFVSRKAQANSEPDAYSSYRDPSDGAPEQLYESATGTHEEHDVSGNTRGDGAEGGRRRTSAWKRERSEESRRRRSNAWRTLVIRVARVRTWLGAFSLVPSLRPSSSLPGESSPCGQVSSGRKYASGSWTGRGRKDAEPRRFPPDPLTEPANRSPTMKRNTASPPRAFHGFAAARRSESSLAKFLTKLSTSIFD